MEFTMSLKAYHLQMTLRVALSLNKKEPCEPKDGEQGTKRGF